MHTVHTIKRPYTLRLRSPKDCEEMRTELLWETHKHFNMGVDFFGNIILTLMGGLSTDLQDLIVAGSSNKKYCRIMLSRSFLTVESAPSSHNHHLRFVVAYGTDEKSKRDDAVLITFRSILRSRGIDENEIDSWVSDCKSSLTAEIREDAVWVNRSKAFEELCIPIGMTRDDIWDVLDRVFGNKKKYFTPVIDEKDENNTPQEESNSSPSKEISNWFSKRFGTGKGADFQCLADGYDHLATWATSNQNGFTSKGQALSSLLSYLGLPNMTVDKLLKQEWTVKGKQGKISGPGIKKTKDNRFILRLLDPEDQNPIEPINQEAMTFFAQKANERSSDKKEQIGDKGKKDWAISILLDLEKACGFKLGKGRHNNFAVICGEAAARVSSYLSWIKNSEHERNKAATDSLEINNIPISARNWLNKFCEQRSIDTGGSYYITKAALGAWDEIVKAWGLNKNTYEERLAIIKDIQTEYDDKFGDYILFASLAKDEAKDVWTNNKKTDPEILKKYSKAISATIDIERFKAPSYRHPDPLIHPAYVEYGNSQWNSSYEIHKSKNNKIDENKTLRHMSLQLLLNGDLTNIDFRWSSKRFSKDFAISSIGKYPSATKNDRLSIAANGFDPIKNYAPAGVFEEEYWNARLQAPREQLIKLSRIPSMDWTKKWEDLPPNVRKFIKRMKWFVTHSANLRVHGPWHDYVEQNDWSTAKSKPILIKGKPFVSHIKSITGKKDNGENTGRSARSRLALCRLPNLRILAIDLGHHNAASCQVWLTMSSKTFLDEISGSKIIEQSNEDLFCKIKNSNGKKITYKRIGPDTLTDGTTHPAPWAKLERSFIIRVQGEETNARAPLTKELEIFNYILNHAGVNCITPPKTIDLLMKEVVSATKYGLIKHAFRASLAYILDPNTSCLSISGNTKVAISDRTTDPNYAKALKVSLKKWYNIAVGKDGAFERSVWNEYIAPLPGGWNIQQGESIKDLSGQLDILTTSCSKTNLSHASTIFRSKWTADDGKSAKDGRKPTGWFLVLRILKDWISGRKLHGLSEFNKNKTWRNNVGGLSMLRINTMTALCNTIRSFSNRPTPDNPTKGAMGDTSKSASKLRKTVLKIKEQRVKQLVSRIIEAATGLGYEPNVGNKRSRIKMFPPCHAIVTEYLDDYRPDEGKTRKENRYLMNWQAGKFRDTLQESCLLHGFLFTQVMPKYTSRQNYKTGEPGVRCFEVPANKVNSWLTKNISKAEENSKNKNTDKQDEYFIAIRDHAKLPENKNKKYLVPKSGGNILLSLKGQINADINAAGNIGLKALMDPDWLPSWWYVPCHNGVPLPRSVKGSLAWINTEQLLPMKKDENQRIINCWRNPSVKTHLDNPWVNSATYWAKAKESIFDSMIENLKNTK